MSSRCIILIVLYLNTIGVESLFYTSSKETDYPRIGKKDAQELWFTDSKESDFLRIGKKNEKELWISDSKENGLLRPGKRIFYTDGKKNEVPRPGKRTNRDMFYRDSKYQQPRKRNMFYTESKESNFPKVENRKSNFEIDNDLDEEITIGTGGDELSSGLKLESNTLFEPYSNFKILDNNGKF